MMTDAAAGQFDASRFVMAFGGVTGVMLSVSAIFDTLVGARESIQYMPVLFELLDAARVDPRLDMKGTVATTPANGGSIEFRNVSFAYPGTDKLILNGLNLTIAPGTSLALVGENGAGKTTLIKLLCRFYDPTVGGILLDGRDIREYDLHSYRKRLAVIFQDFVHYSLPARENIGVGSIEHVKDAALVGRAADRIGVLDKLEALPSGLETILDKMFDGGADLSGGEWQRVALARALMAQEGHGADILVLDEPTASLDVRTEHEMYERFEELAQGRTTILVSHRFSTVQMAARVVYLEGGKVVEDGSHNELIAHRGRYAELYEFQARHFRESGTLE
jgi:ATP-binding cassette subfamily B protein